MTYRGNGCGPKGFVGKLIPDSLLGLSVHEACNLHDERYFKGGDEEDRRKADKKFLQDMLLAIDKRQGIFLAKKIRTLGAYFYYFGVRVFGKFFFKD
jgi:hypothetical protein